jgi:ribosomal protein S18 acetylase RimI-like enzyme
VSIQYRRARADELQHADGLVVESINELTKRHGFPAMAAPAPAQFQLFSLKDDPDGLWVAEEGGGILGFAFSWVCGDLWFLAQLFVAPDQQGRGIGNELLQRTFAQAQKAGARNKALITFAFNTVSQGLYIRHGFYPRFPVYFVSGKRELLLGRLPDAPLRSTPVTGTAFDWAEFARIDRCALGVSRDKHHRYLINNDIARGFLFHAGTECVGYGYLSADGHIGPLAVTKGEAAGPAFATALHVAASADTPNVSAFLPGSCEPALALAAKVGMRITFPMLLMSTHAVDTWACYLPRNPGFM